MDTGAHRVMLWRETKRGVAMELTYQELVIVFSYTLPLR